MHAMWKGTIQIAQFQIPVKLFATTEDKELSLKQTHRACGDNISHLKFCQTCNSTVEMDQIQKVYELGGGNSVEVSDEELKKISPQANKNFVIEQFIDNSDLNIVQMKKHYFVGTDEVGEEVFQLFLTCLQKSKKIGIGYITLRSVQYLAAIRPMGNGIVLSILHYADEVRSMQQINNTVAGVKTKIFEDHILILSQLIDAMTGPFEFAKYGNRYNDALRLLIENKIANRSPKNDEIEPVMPQNNIVDLLSSLQRSLDFVNSETTLFSTSENNNLH
ncbi:Ku protein [Paenibacillus albiflavus]|uniref:Ku protein n=1 Tax=Paenibacillus albiflavus TaxID=2545760 RepID=A0A4R4E307_9BACL|nr:Ku protein [Paenibacillus albiflavus]TCZ73789.1 Ku protein [Paenibacillus albiflavus]